MKKKWWIILSAAAVCAISVLLLFVLRPQTLACPSPSQELQDASQNLDRILIEAVFDPASRSLMVHQKLELQNRTGTDQTQAVLRTYANAFQSVNTSPCGSSELYSTAYPDGPTLGSLSVTRLTVNGTDATAVYEDDAKTVLSVLIPEKWKAGETLSIEMEYLLIVPKTAWQFGISQNSCALGDAFVVPAIWNGTEWVTDSLLCVGDTPVSECANYTVKLTTPAGWTASAPSWTEPEENGGQLVYSWEAPAVRNFSVVLRQGACVKSKITEGVLVTASAASTEKAEKLLQYASQALEIYCRLFGTYPYPSYQVAEVPMAEPGIAYSGLIMVSSTLLDGDNSEAEERIAHLTAHQWWSVIVGSDPVNQAWQDETLCEYSVLLYLQEHLGQTARENYERSHLIPAMRLSLPDGVTPGSPLDAFSSVSEYRRVVYERGAELFVILEALCGETLVPALVRYCSIFTFKIATREDFAKAISDFTGKDIVPLMVEYLDTED